MARRKSAVIEDGDSEMVTEAEAMEDLKERAAAPEFFTEFVDELPANDRKRGGRGRGPSHAYYEALVKIRDEGQGKWGTVAKFHTATGATTALRNIKNGTKVVPEDIDAYEFDTRRQGDESGKRYSVLFARYVA